MQQKRKLNEFTRYFESHKFPKKFSEDILDFNEFYLYSGWVFCRVRFWVDFISACRRRYEFEFLPDIPISRAASRGIAHTYRSGFSCLRIRGKKKYLTGEEDTEANGNGQIIARSNKLSGERYVG